MKNLTPENWPIGAPEYWSLAGYEYQKLAARKGLITEFNTIPWLLRQAEAVRTTNSPKAELFLCTASRLADIAGHPLRTTIRRLYETTQAINQSRACISSASSLCTTNSGNIIEGLFNN